MHLAREQILTEVCGTASVPLMVVRLCAVYGVGDTHDSYGPNRFLRTAREQGSIRLFGRGEEKRPHLWIGDAVRGLAALAASGGGGRVHLIPPESFSFAEVAEWIRSVKPNVCLEFADRTGPPSHKFFGHGKAGRMLPGFRFTDAAEQVASLAKTQ
jgi:nucleoside-diphosphate-sugar epimerase